MEFEEEVFIYALCARPEDARKFAQVFRPQWLHNAAYQPVLSEIYAFTKKHGDSPSLETIRKIFQDKDKQAYELRYKDAIDAIAKACPDRSDMIYTLEQATGVAMVRSFHEMSNDQSFLSKQAEFDGSGIMRDVHSWINRFANSGGDRTMNLKQAVEHLVSSSGWEGQPTRIPCGIRAIDEWTGGGLRTKQVGMVIAPTGHGKSAILLVMGDKIATVQEKNVWYITNELPLEEVTERELARRTGVSVAKIMDDPILAYKNLERYWSGGLHERFQITDIPREASADEIEAEMGRMTNLYGWKPDVIIIDYIEHMKPCATGYARKDEWTWMGAIAKDLERLAKRHNLLIWTAGQVNRGGYQAERIGIEHTQGSIRHLQACTTVISARQVDIPNSTDIGLELLPLKMRQSKRASNSIIIKCNLDVMSITNEEVEITTADSDEDDPAPNTFGLTPREKQMQKAGKRRK